MNYTELLQIQVNQTEIDSELFDRHDQKPVDNDVTNTYIL